MNNCCIPFVPLLPTVYDRALSYEEQLCVLAQQIEKVKAAVNSINVADLRNSVRELEDALQVFETQILQMHQNYEKAVNEKLSAQDMQIATFIGKFAQDVTELQNNINEQVKLLNAGNKLYTDTEIYKVKQIIKQMETDLNNLIVYNPYRGFTTTFQTWIDDVSKATKNYITAGEYDSLQWAAGYYDTRFITAYVYDYRFVRDYYKYFTDVINPLTGVRETVQAVINALAALHYLGVTADEYDELDLTAEAYDGLDLSAYNYNFSDWWRDVANA